jgi:hypothetical protein
MAVVVKVRNDEDISRNEKRVRSASLGKVGQLSEISSEQATPRSQTASPDGVSKEKTPAIGPRQHKRVVEIGIIIGLGLLLVVLVYLRFIHSSTNQGTPAVAILQIPSVGLGGPDQLVQIGGRAGGTTEGCAVVLYAYAGDRWWVQPFDYAPFTEIEANGQWSASIHAGQKYAALLVKKSYTPKNELSSLPPVGGDVLATTVLPGR